MGKTFNLMIRMLVAGGIHDTQCGFKLLDGEAARALFSDLLLDGFAYDVELLWLARRRRLRVAEVGVVWNHSPDSRVHLVRYSARMALDVLRIRLLHWRPSHAKTNRAGHVSPSPSAPVEKGRR
jgi:dolichyl-phosphate beta-glucosyltransferase